MDLAHGVAHGLRSLGRAKRDHPRTLCGGVHRVVQVWTSGYGRDCRERSSGARVRAGAGAKIFDGIYSVRTGRARLRRFEPVSGACDEVGKAGGSRMTTRMMTRAE